MITARSAERLGPIAKDYPETCLPMELEISDRVRMKEIVDLAVERFGTIDVLINNAGHGYRSSVEEGEEEAVLDLLSDGLCKELKPLGIRVMVIEPGSFRTHFYDGALKSAPLTIDAYKDSTWKNANAENLRQQPGDPMKAGELIYSMAFSETAPFRLLLGSDAVKAVISTAEARIEEARAFSRLSEGTDFERP